MKIFYKKQALLLTLFLVVLPGYAEIDAHNVERFMILLVGATTGTLVTYLYMTKQHARQLESMRLEQVATALNNIPVDLGPSVAIQRIPRDLNEGHTRKGTEKTFADWFGPSAG